MFPMVESFWKLELAIASTEESADSWLENEHSPGRREIKVRKNEMKLRKKQIKVPKNLFAPRWRFPISFDETGFSWA